MGWASTRGLFRNLTMILKVVALICGLSLCPTLAWAEEDSIPPVIKNCGDPQSRADYLDRIKDAFALATAPIKNVPAGERKKIREEIAAAYTNHNLGAEVRIRSGERFRAATVQVEYESLLSLINASKGSTVNLCSFAENMVFALDIGTNLMTDINSYVDYAITQKTKNNSLEQLWYMKENAARGQFMVTDILACVVGNLPD